ncbi:MAG: VOC family protein [Bdellovibrionales bacterium]|nr:VOC family protein [Bdellovibrionales bacterium]
MIKGVQDTYYNVTDMKRAVQFYTECMGMKVVHGDDYWTSLDCGGTSVGLHWTEGQKIPEIPRDSHGVYAGGTLTLESTDVSADKVLLESAGAKILGEADAPWGHMLVFEDLDGNVLKLMKPKY